MIMDLQIQITKNLGDQVTFTAVVSGGSPPYNYSWLGLPSPLQSSNTNVIKGVPSNTGTYNVTVNVKDSTGNNGSANGTLIVNPVGPTPLNVSLQINPNLITLGQQVTFNAGATGGTPPYKYSWANLPAPIQSSNTSTLTGTPSNAGTYNTNVSVTDSAGSTANAAGTLVVSSTPIPVTGQINSGSYVGDNAQNRGISHGLKNSKPIFVQIMRSDAAGTFFILAPGYLAEISGNGYSSSTIKAADNNYFYVGDSNHNANWNGFTYYWVAFA
jgi:hypothetical protein